MRELIAAVGNPWDNFRQPYWLGVPSNVPSLIPLYYPGSNGAFPIENQRFARSYQQSLYLSLFASNILTGDLPYRIGKDIRDLTPRGLTNTDLLAKATTTAAVGEGDEAVTETVAGEDATDAADTTTEISAVIETAVASPTSSPSTTVAHALSNGSTETTAAATMNGRSSNLEIRVSSAGTETKTTPQPSGPTVSPTTVMKTPVVTTETKTLTIRPFVDRSVEPTVNPVVNRSVEPTVNPVVNRSVELTASNRSVEPTVNPDVNRSVEMTVNPDVNRSAEPTVNPDVNRSVEPTVNPDVNRSVEPTVNPVVDRSVPQSVDIVIQTSPAFEGSVNHLELTADPALTEVSSVVVGSKATSLTKPSAVAQPLTTDEPTVPSILSDSLNKLSGAADGASREAAPKTEEHRPIREFWEDQPSSSLVARLLALLMQDGDGKATPKTKAKAKDFAPTTAASDQRPARELEEEVDGQTTGEILSHVNGRIPSNDFRSTVKRKVVVSAKRIGQPQAGNGRSATERPLTERRSATERPLMVRPLTERRSATVRPLTERRSATARPLTGRRSATVRLLTGRRSAMVRPLTVRPWTERRSVTVRPLVRVPRDKISCVVVQRGQRLPGMCEVQETVGQKCDGMMIKRTKECGAKSLCCAEF
ncbi:hypothetical protein BV898_07326 [Hypsibius exemplaris]|uniref:Uncharacterized protein n=1 Tax=Hypsibius exemplaris TaxID=2072580 RepID=A0A1W0WU17_HYPEX|nr:hypothetical protein BV898_07326 [Hypsibius exemplaris]